MTNSNDNILFQLILISILILLNAFFAASEMAIVSLNKNKIVIMSNDGNENANLLLKLLDEPSKFLATIQVGITLTEFLASASAATSLSQKLSAFLSQFGVPASRQISIIFITLLLSFFTLVLGELFPKRVALQNADRIALKVVKPILVIYHLTLPFVKLLTKCTNLLLRIFNIDINDLEEKVSEEEIRMMINVGEENGVINETEKEMLEGIFEFDDTLAREIMTPRTDVFMVDVNSYPEKTIDKILEEQYSRVPVYEEDIDNIIGILYMKDLFTYIRNNSIKDINIRSIARQAFFVPESKNIDTLFKELQSSKNYMAILIDEYGGFSGIVTIEDLIEEVMGNIFDEHDIKDEDVIQIDSSTYLVKGITSIDDINNILDLDIPTNNFDTIGGFVISLLGTIPKINEEHTIEYEGITFKVEEVSEKRIEKVKIYIN
jgi:Hemolysins and related proteins containing CBS domains